MFFRQKSSSSFVPHELTRWHGVRTISQTSIWTLFVVTFTPREVCAASRSDPSSTFGLSSAARRFFYQETFLCVVYKSVWHVRVHHLHDGDVQDGIISTSRRTLRSESALPRRDGVLYVHINTFNVAPPSGPTFVQYLQNYRSHHAQLHFVLSATSDVLLFDV